MAENRLNIVQVTSEKSPAPFFQKGRNHAQKKELQAKYERLWLIDPERFNPLRNCMERERVERTWRLLTKHVNLNKICVADIGCAAGYFSRLLRDAGAQVQAIDIAENALKKFRELGAEHIVLKQETMPDTHLPDQHFQSIICTELIAEIPQEDYRLFFAELSRLITPDGYLVCSSSIDIDSDRGVERLIELAQSEFDIIEDLASYHALYLRLKRILNAPSRFIEGWQDPEFKQKEMAKIKGFNRGWYWLNTTPLLIWLWYACSPLTNLINTVLRNQTTVLLFLEKICRFLSDQEGISHYLFIAKRRPLPSINPNEIPQERSRRKEVWD